MKPLPSASIRDHVAHRTDARRDHTKHRQVFALAFREDDSRVRPGETA